MGVVRQDVVHDVLFSETDTELAGVVGDRLVEALRVGETAIVIATVDHQRLLAEHITAAGIDAEAARADDSLLTLDAAATLDLLAPRGAFDRKAFDEVLGSIVRERAGSGRVFTFTEMVAMLFDAASPQDAIELEAALDDLLKETSSGMLCAYPGAILDDPEHAVHVGSVCSMHSAVVAESDFRRSWALAGDRTAGSESRRVVANALRARGVEEAAFYDTLSVVTELVANVVAHARTPFSLDVAIDDECVSVRVEDGSPRPPVLREDAPRKMNVQRGLKLVAGLSARWGFEPAGDGKVVWADLAR